MKIKDNYSLLELNTFGIDAKCKRYLSIEKKEELHQIFEEKDLQAPYFILGGGSNVLFAQDFDGTIVHMQNRGIKVQEENEDSILLKVAAGEVWEDFVRYCIAQNWGGIENLSKIPGNVGACPVQNIGAYGVEVGEVIEEVFTFDTVEGKFTNFSNEECEFGYRSSYFKSKEKGRYIIYAVTFRLRKSPKVNTSYGSILNELNKRNYSAPGIKEVGEVIEHIRGSKIPDPKDIGSAGSFFKNPVIPMEMFLTLSKSFPEMVSYPIDDNHMKLAAGWLIESCGWKGFRDGQVGVNQHQALILINYGGGTGKQIQDLATKIIASVKAKFGISLIPEVNII